MSLYRIFLFEREERIKSAQYKAKGMSKPKDLEYSAKAPFSLEKEDRTIELESRVDESGDSEMT